MLVLVLNILSCKVFPQSYPISTIDQELLNNSKLVVRSYTRDIEVISQKKVRGKSTLVISVINENGLDNADFMRFYNNFISVKKLKATLYNERGDKIKNVDRDNFRDFSAVSGFSLFNDSRVKYIDCDYATIPFTVEYSWETHYSGVIDYSDWIPVWDFNMAIESSKLRLFVPDGFKFRHLSSGPFIYDTLSEKGRVVHSWALNHYQAIEKELFSPPKEMIFPVVHISPLQFEIDNYPGSFGSWEEFGLWIKKLNDERNDFDENARKEILSKVNGVKDAHEKVELLYGYLQDKTRYVNISIGIGGWQPFSPQVVHDKSYGDCKALTHYMKKILEVAGVQSYYTIIQAGQNAMPLLIDFPSNQFNHAILCVPIDGDTTWLECTNQFTPAAYVSSFIDDRNALLISDGGGIIVNTGFGNAGYHQKKNISTVEIDPDLNGKIRIEQSFSGQFYDENQIRLHGDSRDVERNILQSIQTPNIKLIDYSIEEDRNIPPVITSELLINKNRIIENIGSKYIMDLDILNKSKGLNYSNRSRSSDILTRRTLSEIDSTIFIIPDNFQIDFVPDPVSIDTEYGKFTSTIIADGNRITSYQYFLLKKGRFPATNWDSFSEFLETVYDHYSQKCILKEIN